MRERLRHSHETPKPDVNCFPAAENGDDEDDDDEEEEEKPVWTASGALIGTSRFPRVLRSTDEIRSEMPQYPL